MNVCLKCYSSTSGGSFTNDINASEEFNLKDQRKNHRHNSVTKQSLEQDASRQNNGTTETKRSPFSSKTSSLGMPSQKIGFFDMVSFLYTDK